MSFSLRTPLEKDEMFNRVNEGEGKNEDIRSGSY